MTKIKVVGALIFLLSIILFMLFTHINKHNKQNNILLDNINTQKEFTQEISKNIFYIYKNKNSSYQQLDSYMKKFADYMNKKNNRSIEIYNDTINKQNEKIIELWNTFYLEAQKFRNQSKVTTTYTTIIIEKTVNNIYNKNLMLIVAFDKLTKMYKAEFENKLTRYKYIEYSLFFLLVTLLIYLFTQVKIIILFIQKFLYTSQNIITQSSIKELEPIKIDNNSAEILKATNNFNFLVEKINSSIEYSSSSIKHSIDSFETVETNIEDLLELVDIMQEGKINKDLTKKEDALIQSLEELTNSAQKLKNLKNDLDNIISHINSDNS